MQQFNLTDEQSSEYIDKLQELIDLYDDYQHESHLIVNRWFNKYSLKKRHLFRANKKDINEFLNYISIGAQIYYFKSTKTIDDMGGCHYGIYRTRLSKILDERDNLLRILYEANIVEKCNTIPKHVVEECKKKLKLLEIYGKVPFKLSVDWIDYKEKVQVYLDDYKNALQEYKEYLKNDI